AVARRGDADHRPRRGDRRHRRGRRPRVRPAVPVPRLLPRRRQVRAHPAAEPGPAARPRRRPGRLAAADRRRLGQPRPRARPGRAMSRAGRAASVAEAVGETLVRLGARTVFGVVGSGNFHVTNALVAAGARFVAARHEAGAATMADAYARVSGELGVVSLHQGPGLTNAVTGIAEAAKSRTPLPAVAGEPAAAAVRPHLPAAQAVGAVPERVHSPRTALADVARACRTAVAERRTVLLGLPLDIQEAGHPDAGHPDAGQDPPPARGGPRIPPLPVPPPDAVARLADLLQAAARPVFIAGRGARP